MKKRMIIILAFNFILSINVNAEDLKLDNENIEESASYIDNTINNVDEIIGDYHGDISNYINKKTELLDETIGSYDVNKQQKNNSYLFFSIKQNFNSLSDNENKIDFKFKVHLPYTEDKWNFFIDTNASDFNSLEDKIKETFIDKENLSDKTESSVFGFIFDELDHKWKRSYKLGVKFKLPLDPFF